MALELPIHLSFPHLFEENGEMYMTPETYGYRAVCLFHAVEFPSKWEKVRVLVQGADFSDPILFREGGYYWLFATIRREQLVIYYAESLSDRFRPHPINYQRLKGRNAGPVYRERGKLIRPVMNCQGGYGRGVLLKEIVRLTPSSFEERVLFSIEPNWAPGLTGTHTYCMGDGFLVYDGRFSSSSEEEAKGAQ